MKDRLLASTAALILAFAGMAQAQDNMQKLEEHADDRDRIGSLPVCAAERRLRRTAPQEPRKIKLPDGFKINLYAVVPDARHMAVGPQGIVTFVGTRKDAVWAVTDRNKDGTADEVKRFAPSLDFAIPNGVCFSKDGFLYIAEQQSRARLPGGRVLLRKPRRGGRAMSSRKANSSPAPTNPSTTPRASARSGPTRSSTSSSASPSTSRLPDKQEEFKKTGIGGIIRMDQNGANREIYADGLRNPVGFDFDPATGDLWTNDNQVDGMGDDIPPGELNRITEMGQNFGFPWYGGGKVRTDDTRTASRPPTRSSRWSKRSRTRPTSAWCSTPATSSRSVTSSGVFTTQHGSWNRTVPVGARVLFTPLNEDGTAGEQEEFAAGWLTADGEYIGRPIALTQLRDGSLLVSDDFAGAIYRISYGG